LLKFFLSAKISPKTHQHTHSPPHPQKNVSLHPTRKMACWFSNFRG